MKNEKRQENMEPEIVGVESSLPTNSQNVLQPGQSNLGDEAQKPAENVVSLQDILKKHGYHGEAYQELTEAQLN